MEEDIFASDYGYDPSYFSDMSPIQDYYGPSGGGFDGNLNFSFADDFTPSGDLGSGFSLQDYLSGGSGLGNTFDFNFAQGPGTDYADLYNMLSNPGSDSGIDQFASLYGDNVDPYLAGRSASELTGDPRMRMAVEDAATARQAESDGLTEAGNAITNQGILGMLQGLSSPLTRDAAGGIAATTTKTDGYEMTSYTGGGNAGLQQSDPYGGLGTGIRAYDSDALYRSARGDTGAQADFSRNALSDMDMLASTQEGRDMLVQAGVLSPKSALQYELLAEQDAGDPYINSSEDAMRFSQTQGNGKDGNNGVLGALSKALGSLANTATKSAPEIAKAAAAKQAQQQGASPVKGALKAAEMAALMYQAMKKKNGITMTSRANTGQQIPMQTQRAQAPRTMYAKGGEILPQNVKGGLLPVALQLAQLLQSKGLIDGHEGGQEDVVDVKAAPGEYVFDADTVAALGDGNTAAGAKHLDEARKAIRSHKRSAGNDKIPPKSKGLAAYMKG